MEDFDKALWIDSGNLKAFYRKGHALVGLRQYAAAACECLEKAAACECISFCISCRNGIVAIKLALANGLKNNEFMFTGYPVVGFQNRMQTSGSCRFNIVVIPLCFLITSCYRFMDSGVKGIINACFFMQIGQNLTKAA